jgi:hypothetical protein
MLKKLILTVAAAGLLLGGTAMVQPSTAYACKSGCWKAAKAHYPKDRKARKAYRKHCKAEYKASKKH